MALTPGRWIALALVGFCVAPVVILGDRETRQWRASERDRLVDRSWVAERHLRRATDELRTMQLRDSLARLVRPQAAPAVAIDAAFDRVTRVLIDSLVAAARDQRTVAAMIPASVFFVLDTVTRVGGHPRGVRSRGALAIDYVLPTDASRRCVVIARLREVATRRLFEAELRSRISRDRLLGPCAFFEQFGMPGEGVRRWLDERGWQFAQRSALEEPAAPWLDGMPDSSYRSRIDLVYVMSEAGRACAGGNDAACLDALFVRPPRDARETTVELHSGVLSPGYYNPFTIGDNGWLTRSWPLGAREWTLLSDMARTMGRESFHRFWSSELPPEQSFHAAMNGRMSMARWTREWIESTYHPQATGPTLSAGATGFAALLMIAALALAAVAARRRQLA
jgi:hypothetical protein